MLSVIIPVFNCEKYIEECIKSVLSQSLKEIEIVIVDDGSTDSTYDIITSLQEDNEIIKVYRKENGGANSARKMAIDNAEGDYVFFLDADDYIAEDILPRMYSLIQEKDVDMVTCGYKKLYSDKTIISGNRFINEGLYDGKDIAKRYIDVSKFCTIGGAIGLWAHMIKKSLVKNYLLEIDDRIFFGEDRIAWLVFYDAKKVYVLDTQAYIYRIHDESITHAHTESTYLNTKLLNDFILNEFKKKKVDEIYYRMQEQFVIRDLLLGGYEDAFGWLDIIYPFGEIEKHSKIVLFGAGMFGQQVYKNIKKRKEYQIVAWVDNNWQNYNIKEGLIENPCIINTCEYDYILISVIRYNAYVEIVKALKEMGILEKKIKPINNDLINVKYINPKFFM